MTHGVLSARDYIEYKGTPDHGLPPQPRVRQKPLGMRTPSPRAPVVLGVVFWRRRPAMQRLSVAVEVTESGRRGDVSSNSEASRRSWIAKTAQSCSDPAKAINRLDDPWAAPCPRGWSRSNQRCSSREKSLVRECSGKPRSSAQHVVKRHLRVRVLSPATQSGLCWLCPGLKKLARQPPRQARDPAGTGHR